MPEDHVKLRRKRGPNKDKTPLGRSTPASAFARGTPIDPRTQLPPGEEVMIDRATAESTPLDPESARVGAEHHETMTRKARGESGVRWNADGRIRYRECAMLHPNAKVVFKDTTNGFEGFPFTYVSQCKDYDELIAFLKKNCWKGERVTFKWTICDDSQPQWATGNISFDAKEDSMGQQQPPGWGPPPGPPGYGPGYGPPQQQQLPGWYGNQYWDGRAWLPQAPQPYYPPQQPPPQAAPPPPPPQAPPQVPSMSLATGPDPQVAYLHEEIRRLHAELERRNHMPQQQPAQSGLAVGWYGDRYWNGVAWVQQQPAQEPATPVAQPEKPLSPIETAKSAVQMVLDLNKMSNELKSTLTGPQPEEPPETELPKNEDPFPMQVQDFGTFRMAAIREGDGPAKLVEGAMPFAMLNMDKVAAGAKSLLGQIGDFMDMRIKQGTQANDQQAAARRRSVEDAERLAHAQKEIAEAHAIEAQAEALKAAALQAQHQLAAQSPAPAPVAPQPVAPQPVAPQPVVRPEQSNGNGAVEPPKTEPEHEPPEPEQPPPSLSFTTPKPNGPIEPEPENLAVSEETKVPVLSEN